jgi:5-methylcytosine-specific restriction endonuclease McrA
MPAGAPDPSAFRARALARLLGEAPAAAPKALTPGRAHKQRLNKVRNDQRQRALTPWAWARVQADWGHVCVYCGKEAKQLHREHFVPVEQGGTLEAWNVVPACQKCNNAKATRDPLEWMTDKGWLVRYVQIKNYLDGKRKA